MIMAAAKNKLPICDICGETLSEFGEQYFALRCPAHPQVEISLLDLRAMGGRDLSKVRIKPKEAIEAQDYDPHAEHAVVGPELDEIVNEALAEKAAKRQPDPLAEYRRGMLTDMEAFAADEIRVFEEAFPGFVCEVEIKFSSTRFSLDYGSNNNG
jgi:hypothetical protein